MNYGPVGQQRIQNLTTAYENFKKNDYYVTEKLDGSSATFYFNNDYFGVCSRNIDLIEDADNSFWKAARSLELEEKIKRSMSRNISFKVISNKFLLKER